VIILCDIDGVLADCSHRKHHIEQNPKDWEAFFDPDEVINDEVIPTGRDVLHCLTEQGRSWVTFVSGRSETTRKVTAKWIDKNVLLGYMDDDFLFRTIDDHRPDYQFKGEIYRRFRMLYPKCRIFVIDDNIRNVEAAIACGCTALHFRWPGEDKMWVMSGANNAFEVTA